MSEIAMAQRLNYQCIALQYVIRLYIFLPASTELDCRLRRNAGCVLSDRGGAPRVQWKVRCSFLAEPEE